MKTLGCTKVVLLPLMIFVITMDSSIASQTPSQDKSILEESTSYRSENQKEQREKSQVSQTGNDTMEALTNLNETLKRMAEILSKEKSSPSIQPSEK